MPDGEDLADDVAQETLIRIVSRLDACRASVDLQVLAWALAIARTRLADHLRVVLADVERMNDETTSIASPTASASTPSSALGVLGRLVRKVVRTLPEDTRLLLDLRVTQGETWPSIARLLGTSAAGAKRRFQRAQTRLQREINEQAARLPANQKKAVQERLGPHD
jgi:RNA polymerase sigma factor (sigma-70 family)